MNLFQNTHLIQALRESFELSIPQAQVVLIAYQHGSVSTQTVRELFGFVTTQMSGGAVVSRPVRQKLIKPIGKVRSQLNGKISTVYALDRKKDITEVVSRAAEKNIEMFLWINNEESYVRAELEGKANAD